MRFQYAPQSQPLPGFVIIRGIQRGGFGEVYEGVSTGGKRVALKLLHQGTETELRGVRQCLNLSHPHLVTIFDILHDTDANPWIVMEYIDGITLDDVISTHPRGLPSEEVVDWFVGLIEGLEYLHSRGLIHRDLKPANIYRTHGIVKIGDVGLSKLVDRADGLHTQTIGTVHYMAPEVSHGRYGPHVDLYSLAIILFEMLTGRVPFAGETTGEVLMRHLTHLPDVSGLPVAMRPVLAKALAKDPADRFATLQDFRQAVVAAIGIETRGSMASASFDHTINGQASFHQMPGHMSGQTTPTLKTGSPSIPLRDFLPPSIPAAAATFATAAPVPAVKTAATAPLIKAASGNKPRLVDTIPGGLLGGWSQSVALAIVLSFGLAVALNLGLPFFVDRLPWKTVSGLALLATQSAIAVIVLQTLFWWSRQTSGPSTLGFRTMALAGALVGSCGYLLASFLLAENAISASSHRAMVMQLGRPLIGFGGSPVLLAWIIYFAGLFAFGNWAQSSQLARKRSFSIFATFYAAMFGWLLCIVFWFPPVWGCLMAGWISCVLQLSSPALRQRPHHLKKSLESLP